MRKKVKKEYLKTLELGENATRDDIDNAYGYFVKLYSSDHSPELHPLREEFSIAERNRILAEIDNAYKALVGEDAVVRMDFAAESAPQEIHLDEEQEAEDPDEITVEVPEEIHDENEPVVEFVDQLEPIVDTPEEEPAEEVSGEIAEEKEPEAEEPAAGEESDELDDHFDNIIELPDEDGEEPKVEEPEESVDPAVFEDPVIEIPEQLTDGVQVEKIVEINGKFLKKAREKKGMKVKEMAEAVNISYKDLSHIENEKFEKLPDAGYLRWVIKSIARFLGMDETKSAEDYMRRYRQKK